MSQIEKRHFGWYAITYAQNALSLCELHIEDSRQRSIYDYRVVIHIAHLAIEQAIRFTLLESTGNYLRTHDIRALRVEFDRLRPPRKLRVPTYIEQFQDDDPPETLPLFPDLDSQVKPTRQDRLERFRYPTDRKGRPFEEPDIADLDKLKEDLEFLSQDIQKLFLDAGGYHL
ncbi:MAG: hypothetical protein AAF270_10645 [Pseudomonadota bacterium]